MNIQKEKLRKGNPSLDLSDSCQVGNGIFPLDTFEKKQFAALFDSQKNELDNCFFIPASGSGSRMFSSLFSYLNGNDEVESEVNSFLDQIQSFAFYDSIDEAWKKQLDGEFNKRDFIGYLLNDNGLKLGFLPKGMIPFHQYEGFNANPFQEHLMQSTGIANSEANFHFTVNIDFQNEFNQAIEQLKSYNAEDYNLSFSEQDPKTHSTAFDENFNVAVDADGKPILRPAGHGTLIHNLNHIDADIIFVRNIDNMQHQSKAEESTQSRKALAGALLSFREDVYNLLRMIDSGNLHGSAFSTFNDKYDLRIPTELLADSEFAKTFLNRPLRVCGMVRNEGEPGGGPFWVRSRGNEVRQIVEKSQISDNPEQVEMMSRATHFNPVELVCSVRSYTGEKFDLSQFVDSEQYFVVNKTQEGRAIQYIEQPGLWNGAMAHWLTLFYEIDSACFSPVKTVMDLLKPPHQKS